MPAYKVYICLHSQSRMIIVQKRRSVKKIAGKAVTSTYSNYARQWVLPGGTEIECSTAIDAACKELVDETGVKLDGLGGIEFSRYFHEFNEGFYTLFLRFDETGLEVINCLINLHLEHDYPLDRELKKAKICSFEDAKLFLSTFSTELIGEKVKIDQVCQTLSRRDKYWNDKSWFTIICAHLDRTIHPVKS